MTDNTPLPNLSETVPAGVTLLTDPAAIKDTGAALDALFATAVPDLDKPATDPAAAAAAAAAEEVLADKAAADAAAAAKPAAIQTPEEKAAADKAAADAAVAAKDEFDKVELPPHSKPATTQAFDTVKRTARERISAVEKEREELRTRLAAAEAKPALAPEVEKELAELREFRQKLDVEADPTFKEYVEEISRNEESVLAKLKEQGTSDETLAKIKEIGFKELDWEKLLDKLPPVTRRYVENKLAVNEDLGEQRTRAIAEAKKNASEFLSKRETENLQGELAHRTAAEEHFTKVAPQLAWFKLEKVEATATPEQKAVIEANNKFFTATQKSVKEILGDNSPQMRAIAALGYAQMLRLQAEIPALHAEHAAATKALTDEVAALKAAVKEKEDFIARIKRSSTTSLRDGHAPADPKGSTKPATFGEHGSTALDRLREEQLTGA